MKREIKFRGWSEYHEKWLYGSLVTGLFENVKTKEQSCAIVDTDLFPNYDCLQDFDDIDGDVVTSSVGQYTGLKDKNGKEIYEGDVCRILYTDWPSQSDYSISLDQHKTNISSIGIVEYNAPLWQLSIWDEKYKQYIPSCIEHGAHGEIEVIGNIYSDPSLLNQQ